MDRDSFFSSTRLNKAAAFLRFSPLMQLSDDANLETLAIQP